MLFRSDTSDAKWPEAVKQATGTGIDVLIVDTAGRLQNKTELMDELAKIRRVLGRLNPAAPHDVVILEAGDEFLARGRALWDRAVRTYAACVAFDDWPTMAAGLSTNKLQPPRWA